MSAFEGATRLAEPVLEGLGRASLQGSVLIVSVWLICRLVPRLPASVRCSLWWLACLHLLVALVWIEPVRLPLLPVPQAVSEPLSVPSAAIPSASAVLREADWDQRAYGLPMLLAVAWLASLLIQIAWGARELRRVWKIVRGAESLCEPRVREILARVVEAAGLRRLPDLRGSDEIATPQVVGALSPVVLLPRPALERLSTVEISMALCHEVLHIRRGDLWLVWVPALARRLFFFHPLAALAAREYALAREAACDAEVLRLLGIAPQAYGRLLLRLGVTVGETRLAVAGASSSLLNLKRRLKMLDQTPESPRRRSGWWWLVSLAALAGVVPYTLVSQGAASVTGSPRRPAPPTAPSTRPSPPTPPEAPPPPPAPPQLAEFAASYVLLWGAMTVAQGSTPDLKKIKRLRRGDYGLFWFRRGGNSYVIRDQATVEAVYELLRPQLEMEERHVQIGERQAQMGARQAELGARQAEIALRKASLAMEQAHRGMVGEPAEDLQDRQEELDRQNEILGQKQRELGQQQEDLGKQQGELAHGRRTLAGEAERGLSQLIEETLAHGLAEEVRI